MCVIDNIEIKQLYDDTTASMIDAVPVENVYALLDAQRKELDSTMKSLMQEKMLICDSITKKVVDDMKNLKEEVMNQELGRFIQEGYI